MTGGASSCILAPMDDTLKRLVAFAGGKDVELACAAVRVLGEMDAPRREAAARRAIRRLVDGPNATLAAYALSALGPVRDDSLVEKAAARVAAPSPLGEAAAAFLAGRMAQAAPFLSRALAESNVARARASLAVLLRAEGLNPALLLPALKSADEALIGEATAAIRARLAALTGARREAFLKTLETFSAQKTVQKNPASLSACVKILGAAGDGKDATSLLRYAAPPHPPRVRRNAFFALAKRTLARAERKQAAKAALAALSAEESGLAEAAAELLKTLDPEPSWLAALEAAARMGPAGVDFLVSLLSRQDPDLRRQAARALAHADGAVRTLIARVDRRLANDAAWGIGEALKTARERFSDADRKTLRDRILALAARQDPAVEVLLDAAREVAPDVVGPALLKKALAQKDPARRRAALAQTLRAWPDAAEARLSLALLEIRRGDKALSPQARAADKALSALAGLARADAAGTARGVAREKFLAPEDFYYIGFHFAERGGAEGDFGRAVLTALTKRFPRHDLAKAARNKLNLRA